MHWHFPPEPKFSSLSIRDLLDAREAYHVHLMTLPHVIATAIGRYRIRRQDPDCERWDHPWIRRRGKVPERTLENTVVRPWSAPCVLVFVDEWNAGGSEADSSGSVPTLLYLSDGRVVPTCVIRVRPVGAELPPPPVPLRPAVRGLMSGGTLVMAAVQGETHVGSVGCLVTDGEATYALTNRHVAGEPGRPLYAIVRGREERIGESAKAQVGKRSFEAIYPGWPGKETLVNLDAGLIRVDEKHQWTTDIIGCGSLGAPVDMNTHTVTLDLIGCHVTAHGARSGKLEGEIFALFYRYKSLGGVDYVSDLLIGPREGGSGLQTMPGDSGTLWLADPPRRPKPKNRASAGAPADAHRPLAVQWGGHRYLDGPAPREFRFALATFLSTICTVLDVDVVRDWNTGRSEYWGQLGHYSVPLMAAGLVRDKVLRKFLTDNTDRLTFSKEILVAGGYRSHKGDKYYPLADVPDMVWRKRPHEAPNHFADMDEKAAGGDFADKTLLAISGSPKSVDPVSWSKFYSALKKTPKNQGLLPFRVWQIYDQMVEFVKERQADRFLVAAGVLSHYVSDACQPQHVSRLHHGADKSGKPVHEAYEKNMLDDHREELLQLVAARLSQAGAPQQQVRGGKQAAWAVVQLMERSLKELSPEKIIEVYLAAGGGAHPEMWPQLRDRTVARLEDGCRQVARLWASAWKEGGGIAAGRLSHFTQEALSKLYDDPGFLPSYFLTEIVSMGILH